MENFIGSKKVVEKKKEYTIPCSYHFFSNPPQFVRGKCSISMIHQAKNI